MKGLRRLLKNFGRGFTEALKEFADIPVYADDLAEEAGEFCALFVAILLIMTAFSLPLMAILIVLL